MGEQKYCCSGPTMNSGSDCSDGLSLIRSRFRGKTSPVHSYARVDIRKKHCYRRQEDRRMSHGISFIISVLFLLRTTASEEPAQRRMWHQ